MSPSADTQALATAGSCCVSRAYRRRIRRGIEQVDIRAAAQQVVSTEPTSTRRPPCFSFVASHAASCCACAAASAPRAPAAAPPRAEWPALQHIIAAPAAPAARSSLPPARQKAYPPASEKSLHDENAGLTGALSEVSVLQLTHGRRFSISKIRLRIRISSVIKSSRKPAMAQRSGATVLTASRVEPRCGVFTLDSG